MKAVVMAGGEGSRLRPLTCDIPKPMARLCGRPIMEYILDLLARYGTTEVAVTLGYLPNVIKQHFESGEYKGLKLRFVTEEKPLGTAGGVKNAAAEFIGGEPFFVISGDAMCDFELDKAMDAHKKSGAKLTVLGKKVTDPREYGLINAGHDGAITGFIEKPSWGQATSNLANTGIYIIEPDCLALIDDDGAFDFAKDLFPRMLDKNIPLNCFSAEGYWCDIGDIKAYIKCQHDLLNGKIRFGMKTIADGIYLKDNIPKGNFKIIPPVYIGEQADIGDGAEIGPDTVIDDECLIGSEAKIRGSVLLQNSKVMQNASVNEALICGGATVRNDACVFEGSVIGAGSVIGTGTVVKPSVLIWPQKSIREHSEIGTNVKYGASAREIFDDNGIGGSDGVDLTPEICAGIGCAIGSIKTCKKAGIACDGTNNSKSMMLALMAGLMSAGSHVWSFGECFESQLSFCTSFCGLGIGVFISGGKTPQIKVCGEGGLSIPRFLEREIETRVSKGEYNRCSDDCFKDIADMSSIRMMYSRELLKQAPYELRGICASVKSANEKITSLMDDTLDKLGCIRNDEIIFRIDDSGVTLTAYTERKNSIPYEKLLSVCCYNELRNGRDIALPFDAPMMLDMLASSCGRRAYRYLSSPADNSDSAARRLSAKQLWVRDALFMSVRLLSIVKEREKTIDELYNELPEFYIARKTFALQFPPSRLAEFLGEEETESQNPREGIVVKRERGKIMITPSKSGRAVNVIAEAETMEAAVEMCDGFESLISAAEKKSGA